MSSTIRSAFVASIAGLAFASPVALAQEQPFQEVEYTYEELGTVVLSLSGEALGFLWVAGDFTGEGQDGLPYNWRQIGENLVLVNWHNPEISNFVTLIFDFDENIVHSVPLLGYGTEQEAALFEVATIERVLR